MEQRLITLKNGQIKAIYEYFAKLLNEDGKNAAFSYLLYKNVTIMQEQYNAVSAQIYSEADDKDFMDFVKQTNELVVKYADRNEQGEIILDDTSKPRITELLAEYTTDNKKLMEKYKDVLDNRNAKVKQSIEILETSVELELYVTLIENFPNETPPAIVGIFGV